MINLIWAQGTNGEIGIENRLPWVLPADMKHFKDTTMGSVVVMGRKTYDSLAGPLRGRRNIVLTRDEEFDPQHPDVKVYNSHIHLLNDIGKSKVFVIGGAEIYRLFMPFAERLYVTFVHAEFKADTYSPGVPRHWKLKSIDSHLPDEENNHPYSFAIYENYKLGELK